MYLYLSASFHNYGYILFPEQEILRPHCFLAESRLCKSESKKWGLRMTVHVYQT